MLFHWIFYKDSCLYCYFAWFARWIISCLYYLLLSAIQHGVCTAIDFNSFCWWLIMTADKYNGKYRSVIIISVPWTTQCSSFKYNKLLTIYYLLYTESVGQGFHIRNLHTMHTGFHFQGILDRSSLRWKVIRFIVFWIIMYGKMQNENKTKSLQDKIS